MRNTKLVSAMAWSGLASRYEVLIVVEAGKSEAVEEGVEDGKQ